MSYRNLPSIKYRHKIKKLMQPLEKIPHFGSIAVAIILNNNRYCLLSSKSKMTLAIKKLGLDRGEMLLNKEYLKQYSVIYPDQVMTNDYMQSQIDNILKKHSIYRCFCMVKHCDDCDIVIAFNSSKSLNQYQSIYKYLKNDIEMFSCSMINEMLSEIINELPELASSRFMTDQGYRENIFKYEICLPTIEPLSRHEISIIYWSARGKSSQDIGVILGLSKHTVDTYRRSLLKKMHVTNMPQAIHKAVQLHMIV